MDTREPTRRTRVRAYAPEFKAQVLAECARAGASVAKVALAHKLNANMIHTWRRQVRGDSAAAPASQGEFIALPLSKPVAVTAAGEAIRIELRRGATSVSIAWPTEAAQSCAAWMRELLR